MIHKIITDDLLTCCRTDEELQQLRQELENGNHAASWHIQTNLTREKTGFHCNTCGSFYPALEIFHNGKSIDPKAISKPLGRRLKFKKSSYVFRGDHYYATNKKTLLRFEINDGTAHQTDEFSIMGGVYHVDVSPDERYIATETFDGTIAILDAETKQTIAKKRGWDLNGNFQFTHNNRFVYFLDRAIRCWDFINDIESILWQPPEEWSSGSDQHVSCRQVLRLDRERILVLVAAGAHLYPVILHGLMPAVEARLPLSVVTCQPLLDQYTMASGGQLIVLDSEFRQIDAFSYPDIRTLSDGGGVFPITAFKEKRLSQAHLSSNGKWVLFDFFNYLLLMERETGELRYCVYSYTGTTSTRSGFLDEKHIWYNWADSTYIMELK